MGQKKSKDQAASAELQAFAAQLSIEIKAALQKQREEVIGLINTNKDAIQSLEDELQHVKDQGNIVDGRLTRAEKILDDMREQLLRAEARTMRDNLVFYNIPETAGEETEATLKKFLAREMNVGELAMRHINFDGVHRVGPKQENKHRVIVAKFNPGMGKDIILEHTHNLSRDKKFVVSEHLPRELEERKRQLLPKYDQARQHRKDVRWSLDKLVIDNKVTQVKRDTVSDFNINTTELAAGIYVHRSPINIENDACFQAHIVDIETQDEVVPALHAIYAEVTAAKANHNIYAYRIETEAKLVEHYEDDGEWGGGRYLLKLLRENDLKNKLLCVSHWYKVFNVGKARFRYITEAAKLALETQMEIQMETEIA